MTERHRSGRAGRLAMATGGLLLVLCCAGPVLIAGGVLAAAGALSGLGLIAAVALLLVAIMLAIAVLHCAGRAGAAPIDCCPPPARNPEEGPHRQ